MIIIPSFDAKSFNSLLFLELLISSFPFNFLNNCSTEISDSKTKYPRNCVLESFFGMATAVTKFCLVLADGVYVFGFESKSLIQFSNGVFQRQNIILQEHYLKCFFPSHSCTFYCFYVIWKSVNVLCIIFSIPFQTCKTNLCLLSKIWIYIYVLIYLLVTKLLLTIKAI